MQTFHLFPLFLLLTFLVVTLVAAAGNNDGSPPSCGQICDYIESWQDAYCGWRNLTVVPNTCSQSIILNMRGNALHDLRQGEFRDFANLKFLDLSSNWLESLPTRVFYGATQLQDVYIINNHLTSVGHDAFADTGNIMSIYLNRNNIEALPPSVFRGLGSLNILFLSENSLSYVNRHMFLHNNNLTHLSLAHNRIEVLLTETFKHLTQLQFLDVSFNKLHNLRIHIFVRLSNLQTLRVANNSLTYEFIDVDLLESSPKLEILELSNNEIESIPSGLEESHLAKLRLVGNPLICDCSLRSLQNAYSTLHDEEWVSQVTCSDGELLITTSLKCTTDISHHFVTNLAAVQDHTTKGQIHHQIPSIVVPVIITVVVFIVCFIICAYVSVKWIISCKDQSAAYNQLSKQMPKNKDSNVSV